MGGGDHRRDVEPSRSKAVARLTGPAWASSRRVWGWLAGLGLVAAVVGTVYGTVLEPRVQDVVAGESRLQVEVLTPDQFVPQGLTHSGAWLVPDGGASPADLPADYRSSYAGDREGRVAWLRDHGAVAADTLALRLTVRARDDEPVILHGIRVEVEERGDPLSGWYQVPDIGCGGQPVRGFDLDLDAAVPSPTVTTYDDEGQPETRPFDLALSVTRTDPEVYEVHATSRRHHVEFKLALLYDSESGVGEFEIGDGEVFAVTAVVPGRALAYEQADPADPAAPLVRAPQRDPVEGGTPFGC